MAIQDSMNKHATLIGLFSMLPCLIPCTSAQTADPVQVHQDFFQDPGWQWKNNRIVAEDPPIIKQDFGWSPADHLGTGAGEIGGTVWLSRTAAWYALPINQPLSFKDKFSFSCRIAFMPGGGSGTTYLGFFNHELQGWRVWNSMAL